MEKGIKLRPRDVLLHVRPTHQAHCRLQKRLAMGSLAWPKEPEAIGQTTIRKRSDIGCNARFRPAQFRLELRCNSQRASDLASGRNQHARTNR
jgi:hypothetical protein